MLNLNGALKKASEAIGLLMVLAGAGRAIDSRYAKAKDVEAALKDIRRGLRALNLGQLQTARALLSRELFDYQLRGDRLTSLERQRRAEVERTMKNLDARIDTLEREQDPR